MIAYTRNFILPSYEEVLELAHHPKLSYDRRSSDFSHDLPSEILTSLAGAI